MGATVLILPTVSFAPPGDWRALDAALDRLCEFDWLLLTSQNAARFVAERCGEKKIDVKSFVAGKPSIAAVGPSTAQAASQAGMRVDYVAKNHTAQSLVRELSESLKGQAVLLPQSDRADNTLLAALRTAGARVTDVVAYRTLVPETLDAELLNQVRRAEIDAILFASPSAYHNLGGVMGAKDLARISERVDFAAIGPTTARALREGGARMAIEASESSAVGLAKALAQHYKSQAVERDSGARRVTTNRPR